MQILLLTPYPIGQAPSQRFRFEQYLNSSSSKHLHFTVKPFMDLETWEKLYQESSNWFKFTRILKGYASRFLLFFSMHKYDYVFIHREATPLGPPLFEWIAAKVLRKKIVYDFDDAIWLKDPNETNTLFSKLKWKSKVSAICRLSHKISCGNAYLAAFALQYNKQVTVNPTTIDLNYHLPLPSKATNDLVIGWTGSHSTLKYLEVLVPVIQKLESAYDFRFLVISNQTPSLALESLEFLPWNKATEIRDLNYIDIGVMPLTDDPWSKGKCGFKILQYMALKIPAVASPVGVNNSIIDPGANGFLCSDPQEWYECLERLINQRELRSKVGDLGREKVRQGFSVDSNEQNFKKLFD